MAQYDRGSSTQRKKGVKKQSNLIKGWKNIIRGRLFELALIELLKKAGFETDRSKLGSRQFLNSGKVAGRGTTHQIDLIGRYSLTMPFSFKFLLVGEAKYYKSKIKTEIAKQFLGTFTDISQYPRILIKANQTKFSQIFKETRYTYIPVIFAKSGFVSNAQAFLHTYGIYYVSYENSSVLESVVNCIENVHSNIIYDKLTRLVVSSLKSLENFGKLPQEAKKADYNTALKQFSESLEPINSYIGTLDGIWPVHFLSKRKKGLLPSLSVKKHLYKLAIAGRKRKKSYRVIIKTGTKPRSWKLGEFVLPMAFVEEYQKAAKKWGRDVFKELTIYVPLEDSSKKVFPLYIDLIESTPDSKRNTQA